MTHPITPAESKAARAILAWSQTDLAAKAKLAASTIADFERGRRDPQEQSLAAMKAAFEAQGVAFLAGGAVDARGLAARGMLAAAKTGATAGGVPAPWITAADLRDWAGRRDGQAALPLLINHLIRAELGAAAALRFPALNSVHHSGWDGVCTAASSSFYIPEGVSGWEVTAQRGKPKEKADKDYSDRSADPQALVPADTTYVHVTLQPWAAGKAWGDARRAEGVWKDVRVIDGDALVHWIELHASVSHWLATRIGKRPHGLRQLDTAFDEWAKASEPALNDEIVLVDREDEAAVVHKWLREPPSVLSVQAEAVDEAIAFLHAAVARLPAPLCEEVLVRAIVADTEQTARELYDAFAPLVIVLPSGDAGLAKRLATKHYVFVALGSDAGAPANAVRLKRPWRWHLEETLEDLIYEARKDVSEQARRKAARELAHTYAKDAGRSLAVLRRVMPVAASRKPGWADGQPSRALIAAMMAGNWDEGDEGDRTIIAKLSGMTYEDAARELAHHVVDLDGALRKAGSAWKIASARDAWMLLGRHVTVADLKLFGEAFLSVLSVEDPRFALSGEDRFLAPARGVDRPYSGYLRRGLEEFAAVFAIFGDRGGVYPDAQSRIDNLVESLFAGARAERWWSLSRDFRYLAEASPSAFLDAVDNALKQDDSPLRSLFKDDGDGVFDREYLSSLLWAFEVLAWSPELFPRVAQLLVRLAQLDAGEGRFQNRPRNTLKSIFSLWAPQTSVQLAERLKVLDRLRVQSKAVSWELMLAIAPKGHDISHPSPMPYWRDFHGQEPETVTRGLINHGGAAIGNRLLEDVGYDTERWGEIIDLVQYYDALWGAKAAARLEEALQYVNDAKDRDAIRDKLRVFLSHHRQYAKAQWAIPEEDLGLWQKLYDALEPQNLARRHAWLFSGHPQAPHLSAVDLDGNADEEEDEIERLRRAAAIEILDQGGEEGVFAVVRVAEAPGYLGAALMETRGDDPIADALLASALQSEEGALRALSTGMVVKGEALKGQVWCDALLRRAQDDAWGVEALRRILNAMPARRTTWDAADALGAEVAAAYWERAPVYGVKGATDDFAFAARRFVEAGRPRDAIDFVSLHLKDAQYDQELLMRMLRDAVKSQGPDDTTMRAYHVGRLLTRLEELGTDSGKIAGLEWTYYKLLEHSDRPPRMLRKAMAEHPEIFLDLARKVFIPDEDSGKHQEDSEPVDDDFVRHAYEVLLDWDWIPGADDNGDVDFKNLRAWIEETRLLAAVSGHTKSADARFGGVLAHSKTDPDGVWPLRAVRDALETFGNEAVERGFLTGVYNRRGVTSRGMLDGGTQERALSAKYRQWARACALDWPKTAALLEQVAKDYEHEARYHDDRAERRDWS